MISRLLLPSCVRLETYSCLRRSRRIRDRQTMYSARLVPLLPTLGWGGASPSSATDAYDLHPRRHPPVAGRRDARKLPVVGDGARSACNHLIAFGDLILDLKVQIEDQVAER